MSKMALAPLKMCAKCADLPGRKSLWSSSGPQQVKQRVVSSNSAERKQCAGSKQKALLKTREPSRILPSPV